MLEFDQKQAHKKKEPMKTYEPQRRKKERKKERKVIKKREVK